MMIVIGPDGIGKAAIIQAIGKAEKLIMVDSHTEFKSPEIFDIPKIIKGPEKTGREKRRERRKNERNNCLKRRYDPFNY